MRFIGLVLVLAGAAVVYFLGYKGMSVDQARARLAQLTNLLGLKPPPAPEDTANAAVGAAGAAGRAAGATA